MDKESSEVLTLDQAARYLQVSSRTVWELAKDHKIPSARTGKQFRFLKSALREWLEAQHRHSTEEK